MEAFVGVGNGDFSQSLVKHKAVTAQKCEPLRWSASDTDDAGQLLSYSLLWYVLHICNKMNVVVVQLVLIDVL